MRETSNLYATQNSQQPKQFRGGEKKVMKKSLTAIVASAMAFSAFASAAFADDQALDSQGKFDALKAAGIFSGYPDGSAGLDKNMTRAEFAKVLALLEGLNTNSSTSTYSDVASNHWAKGYISAVTDAGLMNGLGGGKFGPNGTVTVEQIAKVADIIEKISPDGTAPGTSAWASGYVAAALKAGLIPQMTSYTGAASRSMLVDVAYSIYQGASEEAAKASVTDAKATGVQTVTVNFNKAIDTTKATLTLTKNNSTVATTTKFADDAKSATLTLTDAKITAGDYTVTLGGLDASTVDKGTASFTAENEKVTKIDFVGAGDTIAHASKVLLKVLVSNQYGEAVSNSSLNVIASGATVLNTTKASDGSYLVTVDTSDSQPNIGLVTINILDTNSYVSASKTFKVGTDPIISKIDLGPATYANGKTALSSAGDTVTYDLNVYDQYGGMITYDSSVYSQNEPRFVLNQYEPKITSSFQDNGNNVPQLKISLSDGVDKSGDYTFNVYDQAAVANGTVTVSSANVATKVQIGDIDGVVAAGDTDAYIPIIAYDAQGNQLSADDLTNDTNIQRITFSVTGADNGGLMTSGDHKGSLHLTNINKQANGVIAVSALIGTINANSVDNKTFQVQPVRVPDHFQIATAPTASGVKGSHSSFDINVIDQYGAQLDNALKTDNNGGVGSSVVYSVYLSAKSSDGVSLTSDADSNAKDYSNTTTSFTGDQFGTFNGGLRFTVAPGASNDGTSTFTAKLMKSVNGATPQEISSVSKTFTVASSSTSLTYKLNAISDLFNGIDSGLISNQDPTTNEFANQVTVSAVDAAGNTVALPDQITSIFSSNTNVVKAGVVNNKAYVLGDKVGTATLSVTFKGNDGTQRNATATVNVKSDALTVNSLTVGNTENTIKASSPGNAFSVMDLHVLDNYGHDFESTTAKDLNKLYGVSFTASDVKGDTNAAVSIDSNGNIWISGKVTSFDLTAVSPNGKSVTTAITQVN
ncbi:S-layer homology domain-containing protein [Paenibacillus humicola]|uniref:S-layer homology domain-containing protein n=1 Tax=Paenibacillus humicola TaxID=3110540 RepID=UPI00237A8743|nr:S-layer homology domain-containing protein [Paenibacillus humicola]